jgi:ABC-type polar amino acid transport system ATPase subunit
VQFGGIAATAQAKTKNIAGGQIQRVAVQHCWFIFFIFLIHFLIETAVQPCKKK